MVSLQACQERSEESPDVQARQEAGLILTPRPVTPYLAGCAAKLRPDS